MRAVMMAHVYERGGFLDSSHGGFAHGLRLAHEGHHCPVGRLAGVHVQHFHLLDGGYCGHNLVYHIFIASLAEIGDALHDFTHYG